MHSLPAEGEKGDTLLQSQRCHRLPMQNVTKMIILERSHFWILSGTCTYFVALSFGKDTPWNLISSPL